MPAFTFDTADEVEQFHAKESWVPVVSGGILVLAVCAVACFIIAVPVKRADLLPIAILVSIVITVLSRVPHIIDNMRTDVVVTNRRLYYRYGIVDVKDHVADLGSITDVTVDPTIFGRMFNYANVRIQTQAGDEDFVLKEIHDAYEMRRAINAGRDNAGRQRI